MVFWELGHAGPGRESGWYARPRSLDRPCLGVTDGTSRLVPIQGGAVAAAGPNQFNLVVHRGHAGLGFRRARSTV